MAAMARLNRIWPSNTISFTRKFTWLCQTRTLLADSEQRILAFETRWFSTSLTCNTRPTTDCIARSTSWWACTNPSSICQETETDVVRAWHAPRQLSQTIHPGHQWATPWRAEQMLDGERTPLLVPELLTRASRRKDWKRISAESSLVSRRRL